jgi:hypothetical protein
MPNFKLKPMSLGFYGKSDSLWVVAAFMQGAGAATRQNAIDILVRAHAMDLTATKSLIFDPKLKSPPGDNKNGQIRIGVQGFDQDLHWLAAIVFHETVHSHQFKFYADNGIVMANMNLDDEPVRMWRALDEFEAQFWPLSNAAALMLSTRQVKELQHLNALNRIDLDDGNDKEIKPLVDAAKFDAARLILIKRQLAASKP